MFYVALLFLSGCPALNNLSMPLFCWYLFPLSIIGKTVGRVDPAGSTSGSTSCWLLNPISGWCGEIGEWFVWLAGRR